MSGMAREKRHGGDPIPVVSPGNVTELGVAAAATIAYVAFGTSPDPTNAAARVRIVPGIPEYFRVEAGKDKVAARAGGSQSVMAQAVDKDCTVVRVLYDDAAGVVEVMEARP